MVPNIKTGTSFRGAQLYYLHDKRERGETLRLSEERIVWTAARNTVHDGPEEAIAEMIATARDQDQLKVMSGARLSGRPCELPVMTISLSWHPSEKPDKEQMLAAADSYLRDMGWDEHQAVYVAHGDTAHPHLHIILNRIHPETGRVLDDAFSKNRSQDWARDYERAQGRIWCKERIGKDYTRADGKEPRSLPHDFAIDARNAQHPYAELEEAARTLDEREKVHLAQHHQDEREAFFDSRHAQFKDAREAAYREVREAYKEHWVAHLSDAKEARREADRDSADLAARILHFAREGDFGVAWDAVADRESIRSAVERNIAKERRELRAEQRGETRERQDEACAALYDERARTYEEIKARQKEERSELKELQAARAEGAPYDKERLIELVTEPAAERLNDVSGLDHAAAHEPHTEIRQGDLAERIFSPELSQETIKSASELIAQQLDEREGEAGLSTSERAPKRDAGEGLGGGLGKVAEVLAEAMAGMITPPTEREKAMARALDRAREEAEPERQAVREEQDAKMRYVLHENQKTAAETFDSFFGEHAERLRRDDEERRQLRNERDRG